MGSVAVAATEFFSGEFNLNRDVLLFAAVSALAISALRFALARRGDIDRVKGDVNDY